MSQKESAFIKWFAGIASVLITTAILSLFGFYVSASAKSKVDTIKFQYIQENINEIKSDIKTIKIDIQKQNISHPINHKDY